MRNSAAQYRRRHLLRWFSPAVLLGLSASAVYACDDFPSTRCVSCASTCLGGDECDLERHVCVPDGNPTYCDAAGSAGQAGQPQEVTSGGTVAGSTGTTVAGSGGAGESTTCASADRDCRATIYTDEALEADCSSPLSIQLEAGCACGPPASSVHWTM